MKKILLLMLLSLAVNLNAQDKEFVFSNNGFTDFIVTDTEGKTQSELYKKALDWMQVTYKNPKEVLKAQIENEYIRIEGSSKSLVCFNALGTKNCETSRYLIEIHFKDNKIKFDVISVEYLFQASWTPIMIDKPSMYYNKKGEIRSAYKYFPEIASYFNNLNNELKEFIMSEKVQIKKSDW